MQTKRFSGDSIDDVLTQVRGEFGDEAVILETRRIVRGGIGGFFGKAGIEVTAADAMPAEAVAALPEPVVEDADDFLRRLEQHLADPAHSAAVGVGGTASQSGSGEDAPPESQGRVEDENPGIYGRTPRVSLPADDQERARSIVEAARAAVREAERATAITDPAPPAAGDASGRPGDTPERTPTADRADEAPEPRGVPAARAAAVSADAAHEGTVDDTDDPRPGARALPARSGLDDVRRELAGAGVDARRLDSLLDGFSRSIAPFLDAEASTRSAVRDYLAARLPVVRDWRPRRQGHTIAFIGQSGVGKTSTAAKVAGRHAQAGMDVALISAGHGANPVLVEMARELGVPVVHAEDAEALAQARRTLVDRDLIVIDTPGCAHTAADDLAVLRTLLGGAAPDEVHLVLPAATPPIDLGDLHTAFRPVGVNRITLTKLDETRHFGGVLNAPMRIGRPLAYIADGAGVPGAIAPADPRLAAELLLP